MKRKVCDRCQAQFQVIYQRINIDGIEGLVLYQYNDFFKTQLFRFKAGYDYALKDVFLTPFFSEIIAKFLTFTLIPLPSNKEDDESRGFNHAKAIISALPLRKKSILKKDVYWKQSDKNHADRCKVSNVIKLTTDEIPKRICLVDDVLTTGNTLKAALRLLKGKSKVTFLILSTKRIISKRRLTEQVFKENSDDDISLI